MKLSFIGASDIGYGEAALYALVGFCIVILVLALLVGIFYLSGFLFRTKALSKEKLFERKKPEPQVAEDGETETDEQTVAAITAAISVILSGETESEAVPEFVIRRITRKK